MIQNHSVAQETGIYEDWLAVFREYGVQFVTLDRDTDSDLLELLRSQPGWTVDFEDREAVLFIRADIV